MAFFLNVRVFLGSSRDSWRVICFQRPDRCCQLPSPWLVNSDFFRKHDEIRPISLRNIAGYSTAGIAGFHEHCSARGLKALPILHFQPLLQGHLSP